MAEITTEYKVTYSLRVNEEELALIEVALTHVDSTAEDVQQQKAEDALRDHIRDVIWAAKDARAGRRSGIERLKGVA